MSGTWVLDSEALSLYLRGDRTMTARLAVARKRDVRVITSAATIVEADPQGAHTARLAWALPGSWWNRSPRTPPKRPSRG